VVVGHFLTLPINLQRLYVPYAPPFVQEAFLQRDGGRGTGAGDMDWQQEWPTRW
jgi:hypothetical protein